MIVVRNIKNIIQQNIYKSKGSNLLENGFPKIWDLDFIKIHNCVICSSVVLEKSILDIIKKWTRRL
jgi:hypothetical protein